MKILINDIEAEDLRADMGIILCIGWKWLDEDEVHVEKITDTWGWQQVRGDDRDRVLIQNFVNKLEEADVVVGHYYKRFDFKFLETRAAFHNLGRLPPVNVVDTWEVSRSTFAVRNSLANIAQLFNLAEQKGAMGKDVWRAANRHEEWAIDEMSEYCAQDVRTTEAVFNKLRVYAKNMPAIGMITGESAVCPKCGSAHYQQRGYYNTKTQRYKRLHCQSCGTWFRERTTDLSKDLIRHHPL